MSDGIELKPCPHCGCSVVRSFKVFERDGWRVDCNKCNGGFHKTTKAEAIAAWNTRPTAPVEDGVRQERQKIVAWLMHTAQSTKLDLENGLWKGIEDDAVEFMGTCTMLADGIKRGDHLAAMGE